MAPPSSNCCTTYGVLRDETTAQAWLISNDPYIYTPQLPLLAPTPTTPPTTHQPTPMRFPMALMAAVLLPLHDPQIPLGLSGTALCCRLFVVSCAVWSACGMAVWTLTSARLWSVGRAGPCVSFPKFPGTFVFGCRLRRACASGVGKLQITNYKLQVPARKNGTSQTTWLVLTYPSLTSHTATRDIVHRASKHGLFRRFSTGQLCATDLA